MFRFVVWMSVLLRNAGLNAMQWACQILNLLLMLIYAFASSGFFSGIAMVEKKLLEA